MLVHPGDRVVVVEPGFGELRAAVEHAGAAICPWRCRACDGFAVDLAAVGAVIRAHRAGVAYVCAPGTPAGTAVPAAAIAALAAEHPGTAFIVDQSFLSLSDRFADAAIAQPGNVAIVRSLTKDFAIPGVRVGYVVAAPALIARVEQARPAWTTSSLAQAAAIAAATAAAAAFVAASRARLLADRAALAGELAALGLAPAPSSTGFLAVDTGDAPGLRRRLLARHRIVVRDCSSYGLPDHIRLAARPAAERARVVAAIASELARGTAR